MITLKILYFLITYFLIISLSIAKRNLDLQKTLVWGPGLEPDNIILPARYFFIHAVDSSNIKFNESEGLQFDISINGKSLKTKHCQVWINQLDLKDGSFIIRYKLYHTCSHLEINILYEGKHVAKSPYKIPYEIQAEQCNCPSQPLDVWLQEYKCKKEYEQINSDLKLFNNVNFTELKPKIIKKLNKPHSVSFCNYVIKNNEVHRKCYGQHVGFKMFIDSILLSLTRKSLLPDLELFVNLGDWPLIEKNKQQIYPMFSWCGSEDSIDIVLPTYDITESTLENMGRVMLDMLSVQSNANKILWHKKEEKAFWRGRDSRRERLMLVDIARKYPELFNVSITNFFFYKDEIEHYGPVSKHISFFEFFNFKYLLNIDGTVAAYRFPYLLGGNSVVLKQDSQYYEYFYKDLKAWTHYIPIARNLSDVIEKIEWAQNNDAEARKIALAGQEYAKNNLLPHDIICYHAVLLNEWSKRISSPIEISPEMEFVPQSDQDGCKCPQQFKDEL